MSLEYEVKKPTDLTKINVNDYGELMWWSYILSVSPEELLTTTDKVGSNAEQVRKSIALGD